MTTNIKSTFKYRPKNNVKILEISDNKKIINFSAIIKKKELPKKKTIKYKDLPVHSPLKNINTEILNFPNKDPIPISKEDNNILKEPNFELMNKIKSIQLNNKNNNFLIKEEQPIILQSSIPKIEKTEPEHSSNFKMSENNTVPTKEEPPIILQSSIPKIEPENSSNFKMSENNTVPTKEEPPIILKLPSPKIEKTEPEHSSNFKMSENNTVPTKEEPPIILQSSIPKIEKTDPKLLKSKEKPVSNFEINKTEILNVNDNKILNKTKKIPKNYNSNTPLVTVIIPMYNVKNYIANAITSVLDQSYKNIELILIDDKSSDNSYAIARDFSKKYDRVKIFKNPKNVGTYISINIGILLSKGEYITILGADDRFLKNKVEEQVDVLNKNPNIVSVYCMYQRLHYKTKKITVTRLGESTIMFRRSIIKIIGYYDSVRFGADTEFRDRIKKVFGTERTKVIKKVLYYALYRPNSLTTSGLYGNHSKPRRFYSSKYLEWHRKSKKLYISFPLKKRPFPVSKISI
jgi:hypothetical protein